MKPGFRFRERGGVGALAVTMVETPSHDAHDQLWFRRWLAQPAQWLIDPKGVDEIADTGTLYRREPLRVRPATDGELAAVGEILTPTDVPFAAAAAAAARVERGEATPADLSWVPTTLEFDRPARQVPPETALAGWVQRAQEGLWQEIGKTARQLAHFAVDMREFMRPEPCFRPEELAAVYIPDAGGGRMPPHYCQAAPPSPVGAVTDADKTGPAYEARLMDIRARVEAEHHALQKGHWEKEARYSSPEWVARSIHADPKDCARRYAIAQQHLARLDETVSALMGRRLSAQP